MSLDFNVKLANETEKVRVVLRHLNKSIDSPLHMKSNFPKLWESMLDIYVLLDE